MNTHFAVNLGMSAFALPHVRQMNLVLQWYHPGHRGEVGPSQWMLCQPELDQGRMCEQDRWIYYGEGSSHRGGSWAVGGGRCGLLFLSAVQPEFTGVGQIGGWKGKLGLQLVRKAGTSQGELELASSSSLPGLVTQGVTCRESWCLQTWS